MLRSPFHAGKSADAQEAEENAASSQSSTAAGVWAQHEPQTEEHLKPPPTSRREQPQRNPTAQASDPGHARRSTDLLGLNVEPPEPWQRTGGASNAGGPSMDDWLPPLPKARPAAAVGAQPGSGPSQSPPQASPAPKGAHAEGPKQPAAAHPHPTAGAHRPLPLGVQPIPAQREEGAAQSQVAPRSSSPLSAASIGSNAPSVATRTRVQTPLTHAQPVNGAQPNAAASQAGQQEAAKAQRSRTPQTESSSAGQARAFHAPSQAAEHEGARAPRSRSSQAESSSAGQARAFQAPSQAAEHEAASASRSRAPQAESSSTGPARAFQAPSRAAEHEGANAARSRSSQAESSSAGQARAFHAPSRAVEHEAANAPRSRAPQAESSSAGPARAFQAPSRAAVEARALAGTALEVSPSGLRNAQSRAERAARAEAAQPVQPGAAAVGVSQGVRRSASPASQPGVAAGGVQRNASPALQPGAAALGVSQGVQRSASAATQARPSQAVQAGAQARELHAREPEPIRSRAQSAEHKRARPPQPTAAASSESATAQAAPASPLGARGLAQAVEQGSGKSRPSSPQAEDKWAWARSAQADLTVPDAQIAQLQAAGTPTPIARRGLTSRAGRPQSDLTWTNVPVGPDPKSSHEPSAQPDLDRPRSQSVSSDSRAPQSSAPTAKATRAAQEPSGAIPDLSQSHAPRSAVQPQPLMPDGAIPDLSQSHAPRSAVQPQPLMPDGAIPDLSQSRAPRRAAVQPHTFRSESASGSRAARSAPVSQSGIPELSQSRPPRSSATNVSISQSRAVGTASESMRAREMRRTVATHVPGGPATTYLSVPPGAVMSEAHAAVVDARGSQGALAESRVPAAAAPAADVQSELIELAALREVDEPGDTHLGSPRLRLDDAALWGSSLHSAQVAYGSEAVRSSLELDESDHTPLGGVRLGSQRVTEPLPLTMMRRAAWGRWLRAALGGVVLGGVASVVVGYAAVWMPHAEQMPVLLTSESADGPRDAVDVLPGEETSASAAVDPSVRHADSTRGTETAEAARSNVRAVDPLRGAASSATRESLRAVLQYPPDVPKGADESAADLRTRSAQTGSAADVAAPSGSGLAAQRAGESENTLSANAAHSGSATGAQPELAANTASRSTGDRDSVSVGMQPMAASAHAPARDAATQSGAVARSNAASALQPPAATINPGAPAQQGTSPHDASRSTGAVASPNAASALQPPAATINPGAPAQQGTLPHDASRSTGAVASPTAASALQPPAATISPGAPAQQGTSPHDASGSTGDAVSAAAPLSAAAANPNAQALAVQPWAASLDPRAPASPGTSPHGASTGTADASARLSAASAAHVASPQVATSDSQAATSAASSSAQAASSGMPDTTARAAATSSAQVATSSMPDTSAATRSAGPPPSAAFAALDDALGTTRAAPAPPPPTAAAPGEQPVLMVKPLTGASSDSIPGLPDQPSRDQVRDTMLAMHGAMAACAAGKHGTTFANVTVQGDGRVSYSLIEGAFAGTEAGSCMARTLRSATFPRFAGPPFKVRYPLVF